MSRVTLPVYWPREMRCRNWVLHATTQLCRAAAKSLLPLLSVAPSWPTAWGSTTPDDAASVTAWCMFQRRVQRSRCRLLPRPLSISLALSLDDIDAHSYVRASLGGVCQTVEIGWRLLVRGLNKRTRRTGGVFDKRMGWYGDVLRQESRRETRQPGCFVKERQASEAGSGEVGVVSIA